MEADGKPTSFEAEVYRVTIGIPAGKVAGYGWIVRQLGRGSARAVGRALGKNPFAPQVPCHRVIRSDGHLGGFMGAVAGPTVERKRELLSAEGVEFCAAGRLIERQRFLR
jgi:methylated-DNA-[protein]-cysteine S-methyltransferase